jgi:hypothetical protein
LCLLVIVGCGPHKHVAVTGTPHPPPTISPLVSRGKLWPFAQINRTSDPRELLISVEEGQYDRQNQCWAAYRATARESVPYPVVSLIPTSTPRFCTLPAVRGPFYVPLYLSEPLTAGDLLDAATGVLVRIGAAVSYTPEELVRP